MPFAAAALAGRLHRHQQTLGTALVMKRHRRSRPATSSDDADDVGL
jgi:hypothetical protein